MVNLLTRTRNITVLLHACCAFLAFSTFLVSSSFSFSTNSVLLLAVDGHCSHQLFSKISRYFNVPKFDVYDSWYLRVKEDHQKLMSLAEREECTV